jgi:LysM repeat protein
MKHKEKPASKISTTQTNTNRKKKIEGSAGPWGVSTSMFKKNDTTLIIAGALIVTLIVFFVFFLSSGSRDEQASSLPEPNRIQEMETRLASLEQSLADLTSKIDTQLAVIADQAARPNKDMDTALAQIRRQVAALESGVQVKVDTLTRQMARLENQLTEKKMPILTASPEIQEKKAPEKPAAPEKTAEAETETLFHTVQKGETLWRISQKYDMTVDRLRQLNNLAPDAEIYPGTKMRVR